MGIIICNEFYDKLRKIEESLHNLKAVKTDLLSARATLEMMGAKREDVFEFIDTTCEDLQAFRTDFSLQLKAYTRDLNDDVVFGAKHQYPRLSGLKWRRLKEFAMKKDYPVDSLRVSTPGRVIFYRFDSGATHGSRESNT